MIQLKDVYFELDIVKTLKTIKKGDWIVFGYASTYDVDSDDTQITRGALEKAKKDLLKYSTVLFNHIPDRPIGKVIETEIDDIGLLVKIVVSKEEKEIWKKIQEGIINKFSIKGRASGLEPVEGAGQISQINEIELFEVSLVSVPANVGAQTISHYIAKSLRDNETSDKNDMEELIKKLKTISKKSDDESKEALNSVIKDLEEKEDMLSNLQIIAGKLTEKDKKVIEEVMERLKVEKQLSDESKEFDLEDKSEKRPVFQLNSDEKFEFDEKTSKFKKQILKLGKLYHWCAEGGILNVTPEVVDGIVKNFKKKVVENVSVPLTHTSDPSKNTGEVVQLVKTDDGLDAVCEIKDETIAEKIKKGLIKHVSVSLDSNYRVKTNNNFVGPTLLHLALVAEPYMKKMRGFVPLSDEYKDRSFIQLEDEEPDLFKNINEVKVELEKIDDKFEKQNELNETFAKITKEKDEKVEEDTKIEEEKKEKIEEKKKTEFGACMSKEMKKGKSMEEASKICKEKIKKMNEEKNKEEENKETTSEESSESKPEDKSKETAQPNVDLADAEGVYEGYLKQGKIVPAQKEAFIKLLTSKGVLELGEDNKVELSKDLKTFLEAQPKIVNFEEVGKEEEGDKDKGSEGKDESEMPSDVKSFYTKMGLSDDAAKEAWEFAKEKSDDEQKEKESTVF